MSELFDPKSLLGATVRRFATVPIEGVGKVRFRSLTELERSRMEASIRDKRGQVSGSKMLDLKCRMIVETVVDDNGNPVYSNSDIERIRQQDSKITNAIAEAAQAHVGISDEDLEDLEKN